MRVFVIFLLIGVAYAAPQTGYNYQVHFDSNVRNDLTQEQYHYLQQYAQQQLGQQHQQVPQNDRPQQVLQAPEVAAVSQGHSQSTSEHHIANQLVQQAQQLAQFEQQQHQSQSQSVSHFETPAQHSETASNAIGSAHHTQSAVTAIETVHTPAPQEQPLPQEPPTQQSPPSHVHHERHQPTVQFNKEFYYLSAPQEDFEQPSDLANQLDSLKKNIRVVFIRAPEQNGLANAALQLAKQSLDQQTVVYVLTKQHDSSELANKLQQIRAGSHSKPDVIFIKYKTPQEAEHAQRTIQAQYEALDGPNHFNHEGVAPTHNFVGSVGHQSSNLGIDPRASAKAAEVKTPSSKYLPAAKKL